MSWGGARKLRPVSSDLEHGVGKQQPPTLALAPWPGCAWEADSQPSPGCLTAPGPDTRPFLSLGSVGSLLLSGRGRSGGEGPLSGCALLGPQRHLPAVCSSLGTLLLPSATKCPSLRWRQAVHRRPRPPAARDGAFLGIDPPQRSVCTSSPDPAAWPA